MKRIVTIIFGILLFIGKSHSQTTYPNNEDSQYEDMLTPKYYLTGNGEPFRNEINMFVHFARLDSFYHPLEDSTGQMPQYTIHRGFGDGIGLGGTSQHHPAIDLHVENAATNVEMYAAYDGYVQTYRDAPKYRDYLSITKNIEDSAGNIIGKMVTLYAHLDLDMDSADNIILDGQEINQGDVVSKHLYSGTLGGPHLHYEIRYYRTNDAGDEEFYGFVGPGGSTTLTEPSAGSWSYGYWHPDYGYGFADPENHLNNSTSGIIVNNFEFDVKIFPNPVKDFLTIDMNKTHGSINLAIYSLVGELLLEREIISTKLISVDLSTYKSGIYFIQLIDKSDNNNAVVKIIKE